jgi:cell division septation protein DedD
MSNEGFHEIQLNGKQLVFLFMAATVVLVVTFLCGVMVGRGVDAQLAVATAEAPGQPLDPTTVALSPPSSTGAPRTGAPITSGETLTYPDRLGEANPSAETLSPAVETAAATSALPEPALESEPAPAEAPAPPAAAASVPTGGPPPNLPERVDGAPLREPPGNGFVVQVAAVRERGEAEIIARRLSTRGYPAFVTTPGNGAPSVFRVRVGKYDDRRDAESIAGRLEREEQFRPWITR